MVIPILLGRAGEARLPPQVKSPTIAQLVTALAFPFEVPQITKPKSKFGFHIAGPLVACAVRGHRRKHCYQRLIVTVHGQKHDIRTTFSGSRTSDRRARVKLASGGEAHDLKWDPEAWFNGYDNVEREEAYTIACNDLPDDLQGTYFRNGPAKFVVGSDQIKHPFDGDGMVCAVTFDGNGNLNVRNRFVRTKGFCEELEAGRMLYRRQFSSKPGGWSNNFLDMRIKNLANTSVLYWGRRLLALWEGGLPHEVDGLSLATYREFNFNGSLAEGDHFTAHPRYDAARDRLVGFQYQPFPPTNQTRVTFWEFAADGFDLVNRVEHSLSGFGILHDFGLTDHFYILNFAPTSPSMTALLGVLAGQKSMGESLEFDRSAPSRLIIVPRDGSAPQTIELDTHFCFHFANSYEEKDELVIDFIRIPELALGDPASSDLPVWKSVDWDVQPRSQLWRYRVCRTTGKWSKQLLCSRGLEFPCVPRHLSGGKHRYVYCSTAAPGVQNGPMQGLLKIDTENPEQEEFWFPESHQFLGEVIFSPRKREGGASDVREDDGYLVGLLSDGKERRSEVLVFDAQKVAAGPICRAPLRSQMSHGLHGCWAQGLAPKQESIEDAWRRSPPKPAIN